MKKALSLFLALALALSVAACGRGGAPAPADTPAPAEESALPVSAPADTPAPEESEEPAPVSAAFPALGDEIFGFTVTQLRDFPLIGAQTALFEHGRTGARLLYIANADTNRVFDLTFFTRAIDNTGLPHIFEHSTLDGSEKYPSKALFFNLIYQTYNTYMNAYTQSLLTSYPVASLSEAQLLKYADYYTDSCLHPMIMEDESIFLEEAWRYRLEDMDAPLSIEGTVYSEMRGAIDLNSAASSNMLRATFPGSLIGNEYGGEPAFIPDMTWESLKDYHNTYYHPSNCLGFLYGDFEDYTAFLKLLDEAFAPYEKREFTFDDPDYEPLTAPVETSLPFPVEAGSDSRDRSAIFYSLVCPGLKDQPQDELLLNTLTDLLLPDASPLSQKLKKALPAGSFGCYIETTGPEDAIVFYGVNLNPEDAPAFKAIVDETLAEVAETGFAADFVDGVTASLEMSTKLIGEGDSIGTDVISSIAFSAASGDVFDYMNYVDALEQLPAWNEQGLYGEAIRAWLLENETTALVSTYPAPGEREKLDAAEAERLAAVKAAMSEEELQAIIDRSTAEEEPDDSSAYVAALQAVTVDSLPEEQRSYTVSDETGDDGVRRLSVEAGVDGIGQTVVLLDAAGLPQEDIHYFALYTSLLGELDTASHTSEELAVLATRYLYNGEIRLSLMPGKEDGDYHPYLRAGWVAADEDLAAGYELLYELLFETQFDDTETLLGLIQRGRASLKSRISSQPYSVMIQRALSRSSPLYAYYSYYSDLDYYAFLEQVEQLVQEDPGAVAARLQAVQEAFRNRTNAVTVYAGSAAGLAENRTQADAFLDRLDARPVEAVEYRFETPAAREALIVDSNVQYNGVVADFETLGLDAYSGDLDALTAAMVDLYLYPNLRDQYGAYGVFNAAIEDGGVYLCSYRDPNIRESFAVYDAMPAFVSSLEVDQETLDGYILSSYSYYAMPEGELSGAVSAAVSVLCGEPLDLKTQYMRELKTLTSEKLHAYAGLYETLMADGLRFTAGGAAAINANADLYDVILNPFGAVDASELSFDDLTEEHPHYEATQYLFEEGLLQSASAEHFGVDDKAAAGELAGMLYALLGGDPGAQQEAMDFFAGYSIVPAKMRVDGPITGEAAQEVLKAFSSVAAGLNYPVDKNAGAQALTRGELAELFVAYLDYLTDEGVLEP